MSSAAERVQAGARCSAIDRQRSIVRHARLHGGRGSQCQLCESVARMGRWVGGSYVDDVLGASWRSADDVSMCACNLRAQPAVGYVLPRHYVE